MALMKYLLVYFLRWTGEGQNWRMTICIYIMISQVTFWVSVLSFAFLAPYVENISMWLQYTGDFNLHISWWIVTVIIASWIILMVLYQLFHAIVLFVCIRGCGYRVSFTPLWCYFLAGVNGQYVMSMLVVIGTMIILAALPDMGLFGVFISFCFLFFVPVVLSYFAIWYTYQSYKLTVVYELQSFLKAEKSMIASRGVVQLLIDRSNNNWLLPTELYTLTISKWPVIFYIVLINGLWGLFLTALNMWSK